MNTHKEFRDYFSANKQNILKEFCIIRGLKNVECVDDIIEKEPILDRFAISLTDLIEELQLKEWEKILQIYGVIDKKIIECYEKGLRLLGYESIEDRQEKQLSFKAGVKHLNERNAPHLELYERKGHYFTSNNGDGYDVTGFVETNLIHNIFLCIIDDTEKSKYRGHVIFFPDDIQNYKEN